MLHLKYEDIMVAGVSPKVVTERLGHASPAFTLATYSRMLPTLQEDAAETLGVMLREESG